MEPVVRFTPITSTRRWSLLATSWARRTIPLVACLPLVLAGCDCTPYQPPAVEVAVLDAATRRTPVVSPVEGILTDGSYTEAMVWDGGTLAGGSGRPGHYTVEVRADGYAVWQKRVTAVGANSCVGVKTVALTALLQLVAVSGNGGR